MDYLTQFYQTMGLGFAMLLLSIAMTNIILIFIWRKLEQIRVEVEYANMEDDIEPWQVEFGPHQ